MKLLVLRSSFQTDAFVRAEYAELLGLLQRDFAADITILGPEGIDGLKETPDYVMTATGGVENLFVQVLPKLKHDVVLVADGRNNSLAAALEILSYLCNQGREGMVLHGRPAEIAEAIRNDKKPASSTSTNKHHEATYPDEPLLQGARIGVFGAPSDWLIASGVEVEPLRSHYEVELVPIDLRRVMEGMDYVDKAEAIRIARSSMQRSIDCKEPDENDMVDAASVYLALKKICEEERLSAMTIRCFDLVKACHTTSCLALALLNDDGVVAGCEGDLQTVLSMLLAKRLCKEAAFMANPSILTDDSALLAHCTIPLSMCDDIVLRSHFESSLGVGIQGLLPLGHYTLFKWGGKEMNRFFVTETQALSHEQNSHFCRTQILLNTNLKPYLLEKPIGNHHVIIKGNHAAEIRDFMHRNGVEETIV